MLNLHFGPTVMSQQGKYVFPYVWFTPSQVPFYPVHFKSEKNRFHFMLIYGCQFFLQTITPYNANLWLAASNAENGVDWLWMGTGRDGKDVHLNYSNWGRDEPRKEGNLVKCLIPSLLDFLIVNTRTSWKIFPELKVAAK